MAYTLSNALKNTKYETLERLLDPVTNHPGRKPVIKSEKQNVFCNKIRKPGVKGCSAAVGELRHIQSTSANDGRKTFVQTFPSNAAIPSFRAKRPCITIRKRENITAVHLLAYNY